MSGKWLVSKLAVVIICTTCAVASAQIGASPVHPGNVGYYPGPDLSQPVSYSNTSTSALLTADESSIGDLAARLDKIEAKAAAAKKKAAGKPTVTVGGRVMADWTTYNQDANSVTQIGNQQNGFEFRRARIFVKGSAFQVVDYKVQYDFAGTQTAGASTLQAPTFKDVWFSVKELPVLGHVKVGHFKEAFGLEELTSSKYITFMERSFVTAFTPARNVGVMAYDHTDSENLTWAIGAFISEIGDEPPVFRNDNGGTAVTTRVTYLPWYDEATEGRGLLHTGVAYSYREIADGTLRIRERPESHLGSRIVDTGTIANVQNLQLIGFEAAFVYGPFSVQSEYMQAFVERDGFADPEFNGVYIQTSYFLTGENRKYKRSAGAFDRVKPFENFFRVRTEDGNVAMGKGAWEIGYRFSHIDLNGTGVTGGNATDHTFGVNWHLNPYTRLMWNYVNSDLRRGGITGNMDIFEMRAQIDF